MKQILEYYYRNYLLTLWPYKLSMQGLMCRNMRVANLKQLITQANNACPPELGDDQQRYTGECPKGSIIQPFPEIYKGQNEIEKYLCHFCSYKILVIW